MPYCTEPSGTEHPARFAVSESKSDALAWWRLDNSCRKWSSEVAYEKKGLHLMVSKVKRIDTYWRCNNPPKCFYFWSWNGASPVLLCSARNMEVIAKLSWCYRMMQEIESTNNTYRQKIYSTDAKQMQSTCQEHSGSSIGQRSEGCGSDTWPVGSLPSLQHRAPWCGKSHWSNKFL